MRLDSPSRILAALLIAAIVCAWSAGPMGGLGAAPPENKPTKAKPEQKKPAKKKRAKKKPPRSNPTTDRQLAARDYVGIPGLGQWMLGNHEAAVAQWGLMAASLGFASHFAAKPDYLGGADRFVDYNTVDLYIGIEARRRGLVYNDSLQSVLLSDRDIISDPLYFGRYETLYQRQARMIQDGRLFELNPLLEFGPYQRLTYSSVNADLAGQAFLHTVGYSVYSAYRDAGLTGRSAPESYADLAIAPFRPDYLIRPTVFLPLLLLAGALSSSPGVGQRTLVSPGMKSGHAALYVVGTSFQAGLWEEALFRGVLNRALAKRMGPEGAWVVSGTVFGLAHYQGGPVSSVLFQAIAGVYFGWLHTRNEWDIRPGIALHFWWDVIVFAFEVRRWKEDRRVGLGQREVHYMPTLYRMSF